MEAMLKRHHHEGRLLSPQFPPAQTHCLDEIGSGDDVRVKSVLRKANTPRTFNLTDGEKANIMKSLCLVTRLDGQVSRYQHHITHTRKLPPLTLQMPSGLCLHTHLHTCVSSNNLYHGSVAKLKPTIVINNNTTR